MVLREAVFRDSPALADELPIVWDARLRRVAANANYWATYHMVPKAAGRYANAACLEVYHPHHITLGSRILDTPSRLVSTLAHEMAHMTQCCLLYEHPAVDDAMHGPWFEAEMHIVEQARAPRPVWCQHPAHRRAGTPHLPFSRQPSPCRARRATAPRPWRVGWG